MWTSVLAQSVALIMLGGFIFKFCADELSRWIRMWTGPRGQVSPAKLLNSETTCASKKITLKALTKVTLYVGGQQFVSTIRTLCAFEGSYFTDLFTCDEDDLFTCSLENIVLDLDPCAFAVVLNALRAGAQNVQHALDCVQTGLEGDRREAIQIALNFVGLEWMVGVRIDRGIYLYDTPLDESWKILGTSTQHPLGVLHELAASAEDANTEIHTTSTASNSRPGSDGTYYFALEDSIEFTRELLHLTVWGWGGDLMLIRAHQRLVLDFGISCALRPSEVILVIHAPIRRGLTGIRLSGRTDFDENGVTLAMANLAVSEHDVHHLRLQIPVSRRRFYRMLSLSLDVAEDEVVFWKVQFVEFFGVFVDNLPLNIFPHAPRAAFNFGELSETYVWKDDEDMPTMPMPMGMAETTG